MRVAVASPASRARIATQTTGISDLMLRPTTGAIRRSRSMSFSNCSGNNDCAPSEKALSGLGCTSISKPSQPAATEEGHGGNFVPQTGTVRRIGQYGQMGELLDDRYGGDVHGIASVRFEGANASFAEHHVVIAARQDVLRRE